MRKEIKAMKELIEESKLELLNNKETLEMINKRIEERHELKG